MRNFAQHAKTSFRETRSAYGKYVNEVVSDSPKKFWSFVKNLKLVCGLFILKFFTKQLLLIILYLKLTAKIPLTVIFVINFQNLLFIFSVNVILYDLFGKSYSRLLKTNTMLILLHQILIRFLGFLETSFWLIYFCVLNITFTPVNFRIKDPLFLVLKFLLKTIEIVNTLLQKSGTNFLSISKNGDLSCSLKYVFWM